MSKLLPSPTTILNVDDHEISRYSKSRILQQAGFQVKEAGTGRETLQLLYQESPSLVLLDVNLPDISGFEVCRHIKNDPALASIMVLQISASLVTSSDKARGLEGGADAYLSEPVEPLELIAHVRALLRLRQAEIELEAQRAFLRQVIDLNPNLIFAKDNAGRFTLANQAVAKVYGTSVEGLIGKTDADFTSDVAELEHFQADDLEVIETQQEKFIPEETITDATGQVRWLQTVKRPIVGPNLQKQVLGVATDITLRKQAQKALTQLNETLEQRVLERTALLQLLQEIAVAVNEAEQVETVLQFALDRICAYLEWPVGHAYWLNNRENSTELISGLIWHLTEPQRFEAFRQVSEVTPLTAGVGLPGQVLAEGKPIWLMDVTQEANFIRKEAAAQSGLRAGFAFPLWVGQEVVAVLEFYALEQVKPNGPFCEVVTQIGTHLGRVVERRRAERRLQQSEEQLLEAQQIAHLGNWQWDIASNRVSWSDELYRIFGLEPQSIDITFEGFLRRVHREDRERVADIIAEAYQTGQPFSFEHQLIRPDGTIRTVQAQGKVLLDATGGPLKMVGIGHDITTQKEIEEQLRHLNTQLEQRVSERTAQLERINQKLAAQIEERRRAEEAKRQLYEAEQLARRVAEETAERIATLQEITAAFSEALTSAQVAKVVVEQGFPMLGGEAGMIVLYNKEEASLTTLETIGYSANRLKAWQTFPVTADTPLSEAVRTKTSLFISSPEKFAARYPYLVKEHPNASHATAAVPLIVEERVLGALAVSYKEAQEFDSTNRAFILAMAQQCAQALDRARLYEVERQARLEAEANQQRLSLLAEMRERNRLAQELHDTVAQALGYLNLKISLTYNLLLNNQVEEAKANFQELKQVIGESYTDVREEIFNLRAKILSGLSFMELLERYVDKYRRFYKLEIHLIQEAEVNLFDFPPEVSSQLIRTIQEALINIRKHAQVSTAIIRLGQEDGFIRISIEDQGRGFNRSQTASKLSSFGLQIMRERVESVDGSLEINTVPGQGTQIILRYKK